MSEAALFSIQQEMLRQFPSSNFQAELGSITHAERLREVFGKHQPSIVYHAAAYKHVPLLEDHPFEAVYNNTVGTWRVASIAGSYRARIFLMISSDKAVYPSSIMGAAKRASEVLLRGLPNTQTKYVSVRFGNVLGSSGSVIPTFKREIANGGPITVTHPEMRRYFMTIPESAQLVIQASIMGKGGEIFELDMGQPVRIVDLARNLILLSGLRPDEDIKIQFSEPRPGEKLYEELSIQYERKMSTYHNKIKILTQSVSPSHICQKLEQLQTACDTRDIQNLVSVLKEIVPEYQPGVHLKQQASGRMSAPIGAMTRSVI